MVCNEIFYHFFQVWKILQKIRDILVAHTNNITDFFLSPAKKMKPGFVLIWYSYNKNNGVASAKKGKLNQICSYFYHFKPST